MAEQHNNYAAVDTRIPMSTYLKLKKVAGEQEMSMSELIRTILIKLEGD